MDFVCIGFKCIDLGAMEWGHEKNDKQPMRARKILCGLSSSIYCVRAAAGVGSLLPIEHHV
jgi:hypothetical protein